MKAGTAEVPSPSDEAQDDLSYEEARGVMTVVWCATACLMGDRHFCLKKQLVDLEAPRRTEVVESLHEPRKWPSVARQLERRGGPPTGARTGARWVDDSYRRC